MIFLTHATEQNVIDAEAKISANCHFPNQRIPEYKSTQRWAEVFYNESLEVFYIVKPPSDGWSDGVETFTQSEMMEGVTGVEEKEWE